MKRFLVLTLILLLFFGVTACQTRLSGSPDMTEAPQTQESPVEPTITPEVYSPEGLSRLSKDAILLQLDYYPTFMPIRFSFPYGRTSEFTLMADGRVIYQGKDPSGLVLLTVQLSPDEAIAFLQEIYDLGIADLESYLDLCMPQDDGTEMCVSDAAYTTLRTLLPDETYREVTSYANFSNQPETLDAIVSRLTNYQHPNAQPYIPSEAALFLQPAKGELTEPIENYPLSGNYAPPSLAKLGIWAFYLTGEDLTTILSAREGKSDLLIYEINGAPYRAELVPWLPGVGYRESLEAEFPPSQAVPVENASWLSNCLATSVVSSPPNTLRLVYQEKNDLYLVEDASGNPETVRLTEEGTITSFQLSKDGAMAYYAQNEPTGAHLWALDLFTREPYPISETYAAGQVLEVHPPSDENTWVPFTILLDERNGELWAAETNGASLRRLVGVDELKPEGFPDCGVLPAQVGWVPGSERLIYDSLPICDALYIQMPAPKFIEMDSGQRGSFPPGELVFSSDGSRVAIKEVTSLSLANGDGSQVQPRGVPFYAIGMGEWWLYPQVLWEPGDTSLLIVSPFSSEVDWVNFDVTPLRVFRLLVEEGTSQELGVIKGSPWSVAISPDGRFMAYYTASPQSNDRILHLSTIDASTSVEYTNSEQLNFIGWSPNSQHFVYETHGGGSGLQNWLGNACGEARPFSSDEIRSVRWLDGEQFVYEVTEYAESQDFLQGVTRLTLIGIDQSETFLVDFEWQGLPQWRAVLMP